MLRWDADLDSGQISPRKAAVIMRKNKVLKVLWLMVVVVVATIFAAPGMDASARSSRKVLAKYKLSATKKTMREGQTYTISLKGVLKKVKTKKLK